MSVRTPRPQSHQPIARSAVIATIDDLLSKVDSKYTLVHLSAQRAREINDYYHSLGEGLGQYTPPLVEQVDSNKPLSIALEEIAAEKIVPQYPGDARRVAEELLGGDEGGADAEIYSLTDGAVDEVGTLDGEPVEATPLSVDDAKPIADAGPLDELDDASTDED
ncbi:MAG TPA: DNA-directed RNA polymerase subunit omega [Euzebyales bacterium]|nr:DNA-directed RNA polymerase subunit omega [Euzebyales bacterium]